jgi:predicted PurR-regulated permease PerM
MRPDVDAQTPERRAGQPDDEVQPVASLDLFWSGTARAATIGIFCILAIAAIELARPVLLPAVSGIVVGLMLGPLTSRAQKLGIPSLATALVLLALVVTVFYLVIVLLAAPVVEWIGKAPEVGALLRQKLHVLDRPLAALDDLRKAVAGGEGLKVDTGPNLLAPMLTFVTPAVGQTVIFIGTLFFFLLGRTELRWHLVALFEAREARLRTLRILNDIEHSLTGYLSVVAVINLAVGVAALCIAYIAGLPSPIAWGVLGFVLNFVPYLGALIMQLVMFAVGLVTFATLGEALLAPLLYLGFTTLEGHFITPAIMGKRLTLSPLAVFLALVFWTWMWGPVGAFLAVPLLIVALVAINHVFPKESQQLPG